MRSARDRPISVTIDTSIAHHHAGSALSGPSRVRLHAGDEEAQTFAGTLGAEWAGDALGPAPEELDAAILFAPAGEHVPAALRALAKGGTVVCAGIHLSDIPAFPYEILWGERTVRSVANLTRRDGEEFLAITPRVPVHITVEAFDLDRANQALDHLRTGAVRGVVALLFDQFVAEPPV